MAIRLQLQVLRIRIYTYFGSLLDRYLSTPSIIQPTSKRTIPSLPSNKKGNIQLLFYEPSNPAKASLRPAVINFHGGGWIFGTPQMDARWAQQVVNSGSVLISAGYRLAPSNPFPIPVEDCAEAILWVHSNAQQYGLDKDIIVLSGFSAGGNLVFASAMRLYAKEIGRRINLAGIISFYPLLDRTISEEAKAATNPIAAQKATLKHLKKIFDDSYLGLNPRELESPYHSPGIATDELLKGALPDKIAIFTCGWDTLCNKGKVFRTRLAGLGKTASGRVFEEVVHAFDRFPTLKKGNPKMDQMYDEAIITLDTMLCIF